jgi:hypothetical protein
MMALFRNAAFPEAAFILVSDQVRLPEKEDNSRNTD